MKIDANNTATIAATKITISIGINAIAVLLQYEILCNLAKPMMFKITVYKFAMYEIIGM